MAEEKVAELKKQLEEKTAENEALKEKVEELKEQLKKFLGEEGVDGLKDKLGNLACGSDDAEEGKESPAKAAADFAKSFF